MFFNDLKAFDIAYYEVRCSSYIFEIVFCYDKSKLQAFEV